MPAAFYCHYSNTYLKIKCYMNMRQIPKQALLVLMAIALPAMLLAQITVSGTVTDASSNPVPGATVRVKSSNIGTATDPNGKFTLTIPGKSAVLEISAVSLKTQMVSVTANTGNLSIQLPEDVGKLDEV